MASAEMTTMPLESHAVVPAQSRDGPATKSCWEVTARGKGRVKARDLAQAQTAKRLTSISQEYALLVTSQSRY